jgi:hypothetical protein
MFIRKPPLGSGDAAKSQSSGYIHQFLEMYLYGLVVVLTAVLFRVHGEQFHCENGQLFCYWTRLAPSNWTTAYGAMLCSWIEWVILRPECIVQNDICLWPCITYFLLYHICLKSCSCFVSYRLCL